MLFTWISFLLWDHSNKLVSVQVEKSICPSFQLVLIPPSPAARTVADKEGLVRNRKQRARNTPILSNTAIVSLTLCVWGGGLEGAPEGR